jgi:hypothetical protein
MNNTFEDNTIRSKNWLPLMEYSAKHGLSISTLRRRIKDKSIEFQLQDGKYFLKDEIVIKNSSGRKTVSPKQGSHLENQEGSMQISHTSPIQNNLMAQVLVEEIKKAYTQVLHEKEEQIFQLKEEVSDLKTLVKVLESEIKRLTSSDSIEMNSIDL